MARTVKTTAEVALPAGTRRTLFTAAWRDRRTWVCALLLAALVFVVHVNDLGHGFVYDDEDNIVKNPHFRGLGPRQLGWMFTTFHMGHYQPLSWATLGLDYVLWGDNPTGFHLTNLILHVGNAVLVYLLALALLGARPAHTGRAPAPVAWSAHMAAVLAALLFAVHPLRVESVAWVTERRDVLSSFFMVLAVLFYLHAHGGTVAASPRVWVVLALAALTLSLLSRAMAITLPVILLILDWYPLRRLGGPAGSWTDRAARRAYLEKIPFCIVALIFTILAPLAQQAAGARATLTEHGLLERLAQACYGLVFYLWKTVLAVNLSPLYEIPQPMVLSSAKYVVPALLVLAATVLLLVQGRRWPWLTVVALVYVVLLAPVLGLVQSGSQEVADRYSYLPVVGWGILAAAGWLELWRRWRPVGVGGIVVGSAAVVILATLTWRQSLAWRDSVSLWEQAVRAAPSATTHQNLGAAYARTGRLQEAIAQYRSALELDALNRPSLHGLAKALTDTNQFDEAVAAWERVLQYNPENMRARLLLARVQRARGHPESAQFQYAEALRFDPRSTEARLGLAAVLAERGRLDEASAECRKVLEAAPDHPGGRYTLGNIRAQQGRFAEAAAEFRRALEAQPDFPEAGSNLGLALEYLGRLEDAVQAYQAVLNRHPDEVITRYNMGNALSKLGRRQEAIAEFREVLARNPQHAPARKALDNLLAAP